MLNCYTLFTYLLTFNVVWYVRVCIGRAVGNAVLRACNTDQPSVRRCTQQPGLYTQGRRQHTGGNHFIQDSSETETGFSRCFMQPGTLPSGKRVLPTVIGLVFQE